MEKIKAYKIEFQQVEGLSDHWSTKKVTYENCDIWAEVEDHISQLSFVAYKESKKHNLKGGYYKSDFWIYFTDGEIYDGRYDVDPENKEGGLVNHILYHLNFTLGKQKPAHWTNQQYTDYMFQCHNDKIMEESFQACQLWYDNYQFGE